MLFYSKASQKSVAQPNEKYMCSASGKMYDSLSWYYFSIVFLEAKYIFTDSFSYLLKELTLVLNHALLLQNFSIELYT